jgi:hypothetical protein
MGTKLKKSVTGKERVVHTLLIILTCWPLLHIFLVKQFDLNAWKLAGWGMYSVPLHSIRLEITQLVKSPQGWTASPISDSRLNEPVSKYMDLRFALGKLMEPSGLARSVFEAFPTMDRINIRVSKLAMDRSSGMIEESHVDFLYDE